MPINGGCNLSEMNRMFDDKSASVFGWCAPGPRGVLQIVRCVKSDGVTGWDAGVKEWDAGVTGWDAGSRPIQDALSCPVPCQYTDTARPLHEHTSRGEHSPISANTGAIHSVKLRNLSLCYERHQWTLVIFSYIPGDVLTPESVVHLPPPPRSVLHIAFDTAPWTGGHFRVIISCPRDRAFERRVIDQEQCPVYWASPVGWHLSGWTMAMLLGPGTRGVTANSPGTFSHCPNTNSHSTQQMPNWFSVKGELKSTSFVTSGKEWWPRLRLGTVLNHRSGNEKVWFGMSWDAVVRHLGTSPASPFRQTPGSTRTKI